MSARRPGRTVRHRTVLTVVSAAVSAASLSAYGQAIVPQMMIAFGQTTTTGEKMSPNEASVTGINERGDIGYRDSNNYLARVSLTPTHSVVATRMSLAPSPSRFYRRNPMLLDDGRMLSADSEQDPITFAVVNRVRVWDNGSFSDSRINLPNVVGPSEFAASPDGRFTAVLASAHEGNTQVPLLEFAGPNGITTEVLSNIGTVLSPNIATNGRLLVATFVTPTGYKFEVREPGGATTPLPFPVVGGLSRDSVALSRDGNAVAAVYGHGFDTQNSVFLRTATPTGSVIDRVVTKSVADSTVDGFESWRDKNHDRIVQQNEISGGIGEPSAAGVGVVRISRPLGDQYMTVFLAETPAGGTIRAWYARSSAESGQVYGSAQLPGIGNHSLPGNPVNSKGQIVYLVENAAGQQEAFRFNANTFTKYKQGGDNNDLTALASDPATRWFDQPINSDVPVAKQKKFSSVGCALTSIASITSFYGLEVTPRDVRNIMQGNGDLVDGTKANGPGNNAKIGNYSVSVGNKTLYRADIGGTFNDIVSEILGGNAVLLAVPIKGSIAQAKDSKTGALLTLPDGTARANDNRHYIMAYGLREGVQAGDAVTAADILISDPAYSIPYRSKYASAYGAGEELVHVSLQDYFNIQNSNTQGKVFSARDWFDSSTFTVDGTTVQVQAADRARQIQRWRVTEGPAPANPSLDVFSPVELVVTISGQRYVSSPELALAGDIVLARTGQDVIAEFDEVNETGLGEADPVERFSAYSLLFPAGVAGSDLDVQILGIGEGDYTLRFNPGLDSLFSSDPIAGFIHTGESATGHFTVTGSVPEPSALVFATLAFVAGARRRR